MNSSSSSSSLPLSSKSFISFIIFILIILILSLCGYYGILIHISTKKPFKTINWSNENYFNKQCLKCPECKKCPESKKCPECKKCPDPPPEKKCPKPTPVPCKPQKCIPKPSPSIQTTFPVEPLSDYETPLKNKKLTKLSKDYYGVNFSKLRIKCGVSIGDFFSYRYIPFSFYNLDIPGTEYLFSYDPYPRPSPIFFPESKKQASNILKNMIGTRPHNWNAGDSFLWGLDSNSLDYSGKKSTFINYVTKFSYIAHLKKAFCSRDGRLFFDTVNRVILNTNSRHFALNNINSLIPQVENAKRNNQLLSFKKLFAVLNIYAYGYWHFLIEVIPTLVPLLPALEKHPEIPLLIPVPNDVCRQYLNLLGIEDKRIIKYQGSPSTIVYADEMIVPPMTSTPTTPRENLLLTHKYFVKKRIPIEKKNKIILVSRRSGGRRSLINTFQVMNKLRQLNGKTFKIIKNNVVHNVKLEVIEFDGSTLGGAANQIKIFSEAFIIIGPPGAGLGNAIWSAPGTPVIQFITPANKNMCHWHVSTSLCDPFYMIQCNQVGGGFDANYNCDPNKIFNLSNKIIENKNNNWRGCVFGCQKSLYHCDSYLNQTIIWNQ